MTNTKQIKTEARLAFDQKNYSLAFQTLWKAGIEDFINYGDSESRKKVPIKENWFLSPKSSAFFWKDFILREDVYNHIFNSDSAEHLLHLYFSKSRINSLDLERKLAKDFPDLYIRAIRLNQGSIGIPGGLIFLSIDIS